MSNWSMKQKLKQKNANIFRRFLKNSKGSLTPMLGLAAIPFFLAAGAAIDMARVNREQASFYGAVDGAALAIAADDRSALEVLSTQAQKDAMKATLEQYAQKYLEENYKDASGGAATVDVDLSITGSDIKVDATLEFPMAIMQLAGIDTMTLKASSTIKKAMKPIELVMALDTTGSMRNDMTGLKTAANDLLKKLYADGASKNMSSEYIRIGLVPFSAAVRLDTSAYDYDPNWIDTTGANPLSHIHFTDPTWNNYMAWGKIKKSSTAFHQWNGCVEARKRGNGTVADNYITGDVAPSNVDIHSKFPAYFNPDSPSFYSPTRGTTASPWGSGHYPTNTTGSYTTGTWANNYINAYWDYRWAANTSVALESSLLAPAGSRKTGFDDSGIGNINVGTAAQVFDARFKNQAKYDGLNIGDEVFSLSGVTWSVTDGPWENCTASKIVPMTYNRAKVEAGITAMKSYGGTNIAEGLAWGMRALSPTEPFTKVEGAGSIPANTIAPYNGPRWQKILVLMSDGENDPYARYSDGSIANFTDTGTSYNALGYSNVPTAGGLNRFGTTNINDADNQMDTYTTTMCDNLKANGVTIYSIGFRVDSTLLKNCATSTAHYKYATSITDLVAYFDHIGQDVLNKMIYVSK